MTEENYTINRYKRILFYILILVLLAGFVIAEIVYPSEREDSSSEANIMYTGTFVWEKPDGTKEEIEIPGNYELAPGETMVITTRIPEDYHENAIAIRSSMQNVRISIDGELRTEYNTERTRPFGKNSISRYIFCETSEKDAGKELRIELKTGVAKYSGVVNTVYCGDKSDIWESISRHYTYELVIALFILFTGFIVLIFSLALGIAYKTRFDLEYLGWCMILGAVWMICESKLRQLYAPNVSVLGNVCYFAVMLCPIPVLFYMDSIQRGRYKKTYHVIECIAVLNLLISTILQFTNTADFIETLPIAHIVIAITFLAIAVTCCLDLYYGRTGSYRLLLVGIVIAMFAVLLEEILMYFVVLLSGFFIGIGLLSLLIVTIIQTIENVRKMEQAHQREVQDSMDYLTGLPMRNKGEKLIAQAMQKYAGCLAFIDMDNLKKINDIYGHKAGDHALKLLGDMLKECSGNAIACRLGGDEFLLFLPDISQDEAGQLIEGILKKYSSEKDKERETCGASLSCGLCMCSKGEKFEECYIKADKALYYQKQNGKNNFIFYQQMEKEDFVKSRDKKDLEIVASVLRESGKYSGALDLDYREFAKIYEYLNGLGQRYRHRCYLVMVTMNTKSEQVTYIDNIEEALECMEKSIRENIRKVDVCTRYSSMQYLMILLEADEKHIPEVMERIFEKYYQLYRNHDFIPNYEYLPMNEL